MGIKKHEANISTLYDRVKKLLVSDEWSDCSFSVSGKVFKTHKLILGISSPVFEAMFYGPLSANSEIIIPDIEPDIFHHLLHYIYTDDVEISSIEDAFALLYASRKYLLEHLSTICINYVQKNISIDNVITILNYPDFMQDKQLISSALKLFCEHADYLVKENKSIISLNCMKLVLQCNQMNINEKDLIKHVFEWTNLYCEQNDIPAVLENRRNVLIKNNILELMRFRALSSEELHELDKDVNNLLLISEREYIAKLLMGLENIDSTRLEWPMNYSPTKRISMNLCPYYCHRINRRSVPPIVIDSNNFAISTRVRGNKSVFITSVRVPARMTPHFEFTMDEYTEVMTVSVICESDKKVVNQTHVKYLTDYDQTNSIQLSSPCLIQKDKWYKINFGWPQDGFQSYCYPVECRDKLYKNNIVKFEFEDEVDGQGSFLEALTFCL